tara:strand:+ start:41214 stop:42257 length:1044 start_codon:yes stop_codon:yes gene_type:complete
MAKFNRPQLAERQKKKNSLLSFPSTPYPHGILLLFKEYDYAQTTGSGSYSTLTSGIYQSLKQDSGPDVVNNQSVELPFPKQLSDQNGIKVNGFERSFAAERLSSFASSALGGTIAGAGTAAAGAVKDAASAGGSVLSKLKNIGENINANPDQVKKDLMSTLNMSGQNVSQILSYLMQNYSGDIGRAMSAAGGAAINPNETLAFEGVDLKSYTMQWDLFPENEQDSEGIKNIITLIRQNILPSYGSIDGLGDVNRALLNYPSVVFIELLGVDPSHWQRFKPCMISNLTVDYGGGGQMAVLKGGKPVAVTLSITFNELSIHTKEDYPDTVQTEPQTEAEPSGENQENTG